MSASSLTGHRDIRAISALPPKADMCSATRDVRYVPIADIPLLSQKNLGLAKTNKPLPEIFAAVKLCNCTRTIFNAVGDILSIAQAAIAHPLG